MRHRDLWESIAEGCYYELIRVDNPRHARKFGWHLRRTDTGAFRDDFYLSLDDGEFIAHRRANEHCRHLGMRPVRLPLED